MIFRSKYFRVAIPCVIGVLLLTVAMAHADRAITFGWDYDATAYEDLAEFRLYKRLGDAPYDYETPWAKIPVAGGSTENDGVRTWNKQLDLVLPADTRGEFRFVMRAVDKFGNESGDSNEVGYEFKTTAVPEVLQFRIVVQVD